MLNLVAKPEDGYRFVNWTGDVGTIANVNAAQTTITMNDNYSITVNFEEKPPVSWALIGGIIAAVVVVGLAIFFVRRRRAAQVKRQDGSRAARKKRR
jgi:ATP-dependent Zn protease